MTMTELGPPLMTTLVCQRINNLKLFSNNGNIYRGGGARGAIREALVRRWVGSRKGPLKTGLEVVTERWARNQQRAKGPCTHVQGFQGTPKSQQGSETW